MEMRRNGTSKRHWSSPHTVDLVTLPYFQQLGVHFCCW